MKCPKLLKNYKMYVHIRPEGVVTKVILNKFQLEADIEFVSPCQKEIEAYVANDVDVFAYSFDYMPRGPLVEEEHWHYTLFGDTPVTVKKIAQGEISLKISENGVSNKIGRKF